MKCNLVFLLFNISNRTIFDTLGKIDDWHKELFHSLGKAYVKHGEVLELFNLYSEEEGFGNKEIPKKILEKENMNE